MLRIVDLGPIPETIAVLVRAFRLFVIKRDGIDTKLRQRVQLRRFRDAIVVCVLPQSQRAENGVVLVDDSIAVSALRRLVVFSQSEKSISLNSRRRWRLCREVSEQLRTVIN